MARLASIEKNNWKKERAKKYYAHREELRRKAVDPKASDEERDLARKKLQALPRSTSHIQIVNRCMVTGRPRGNLKKFGMCRLVFRQMALDGKLPGVTKASW